MSSVTDKRNIQWFPGHMMKTLRAIEADIKHMDIALILLDARIPHSSMNPELERLAASKPRLYILNKADLADPVVTAQWLTALRKEGTSAVAINSKNKGSVGSIKSEIDLALTELLARRAGKGMQGTKIQMMLCGIPNVGKSTFINTFCGEARAKTADRPGVTRGKQWITAGKYDLLDMPGVLWKKFENTQIATNLAFIGSIKDDILDIEEIAAGLIAQVKKNYFELLQSRYKLTQQEMEKTPFEIIEAIAKSRGMLLSGGICDTERASAMLLDEFRGSKLGRITLERPADYEQFIV